MANESGDGKRRRAGGGATPHMVGEEGVAPDAPLGALVRAWREEAATLRTRYGMRAAARLCETHARELADAMRREAAAVLTLEQASAYSGYSPSHLRALQPEGRLSNAGRKGSPRFFRGELPRKPVRPAAEAEAPPRASRKGFDAEALARTAVGEARK